MSIKILHTADLHLDTSFREMPPDKIGERKADLLNVFKKILEIGQNQKVDLIIIAGDLFETPIGGSGDTLRIVKDQFSRISPRKIVITPGNHDPCIIGSPYYDTDWPSNIHIFRDNQFEALELNDLGVRIYGIANTKFNDDENYLRNLRIDHKPAINIVIMHGSCQADWMPEKYSKELALPFTLLDLKKTGADYYALGHYHEFKAIGEEDRGVLGCYPGCPEGRGFDEEGEKGIVLAEISKKSVDIKHIPTCIKRYQTLEFDCSGLKTKEDIVEEIRRQYKEEWKQVLAKICLYGEYDPGLSVDLEYISREIRALFYYVRVATKKNNFYPSYNLDEIESQRNVVGEFVRLIKKQIAETSDENEKLKLKHALYYGLDGFYRSEVKDRYIYMEENNDNQED